jgi:GNAT superfamily N-acetyltransferase
MIERSTVGSLLRAEQAHCAQLCRKDTLDYGIAYTCDRFSRLPEVNQFREVVIDDPGRIPLAFDQTRRHFEERGVTCFRWSPAGGAASGELDEFLVANGFRRETHVAMLAVRWVERAADPGVRVLPARAMRSALRATFVASPSCPEPAMAGEAAVERMDDPRYELLVAMVEGRPAGRCAFHEVGDIARIMDLDVLPEFQNHSVERALLAHVLALARRLAMRNICTTVQADDTHRIAQFLDAGFAQDGTIVEYERLS